MRVLMNAVPYLLGLPFSHLLGLSFRVRQQRLAAARPALDEREFVRRITDQGGDSMAAAFMWKHLKEWTSAPDFTPYPTDDLGSVFGLHEEERDEDIVLHLLQDLNVPVPDQEVVLSFGEVDTPLQVALFVAFCRKYSRRTETRFSLPCAWCDTTQRTYSGFSSRPATLKVAPAMQP